MRHGRSSAKGSVLTTVLTATRTSATTRTTAAASTRRAGLRLVLRHRHDNPFAIQFLTARDTDEATSARSSAACFNGRIIRCLLHVFVNASVSFIRRVWRATAAAARARRTASR